MDAQSYLRERTKESVYAKGTSRAAGESLLSGLLGELAVRAHRGGTGAAGRRQFH